MNSKVAIRKCDEYDIDRIFQLISEIYRATSGPEVRGKKVLLKPNILGDHDPAKCISTHPTVVEAMVRFLQSEGAEVFIGDSPAIHISGFRPDKSGISGICETTGATWVDFLKKPVEKKLRKGKIKVASAVNQVDVIISLPKFKNHELVYFSGAIKNTLGLVPGFNKTKQHALHHDRNDFSEFLVQLNEAVLPDYFLIDGIMGMEGPGPARGIPAKVGLLIGSSNPLAADIMCSKIAGYDPMNIPTNRIAMSRKTWLQSEKDLVYDGPVIESIIRHDFKRIPLSGISNISLKFILDRITFLRKIDRRPVFIDKNCIGCHRCIEICPTGAISPMKEISNHILLTDKKCIRCFCCSEVCSDNAVQVRRKFFGQ